VDDHVDSGWTGHAGDPTQYDGEFAVTEGLGDRDVSARRRGVGERRSVPSRQEQDAQPRDQPEAPPYGNLIHYNASVVSEPTSVVRDDPARRILAKRLTTAAIAATVPPIST
jgi:hypothetical protein